LSWTFLVVVLAVVAVPGADFVVTLRNTIVNGRTAGVATALGISAGSLIQGTLASLGVGVLIVQSQLLFTTLKWAGLAYLGYLGAQSLWSAWRGHHDEALEQLGTAHWARSLRQGFLTNMTNPKMLVFYLSLLPQFVSAGAGVGDWLIHAWMLPVVGTTWLLVVVVFGNAAREKLLRPVARRVMDAVSGLALLGFAAKLAFEHD
jgi:threonine/homoserine/homoserine lactone efflux protein